MFPILFSSILNNYISGIATSITIAFLFWVTVYLVYCVLDGFHECLHNFPQLFQCSDYTKFQKL